ncbi:hypothetical protein D9758_005838 [Tetrapyrgos nigripes]|uniref:SHSP domain-containing protein n=1 Tax=Tetrapyrgos nigripes TaxID=182062 RepID=A0A8H5LH95_9AGAR|nr:hypothetical protein D9758_005838 [Tetrapyrgos nigripes]
MSERPEINRTASHSKRHASFNSPREVPLPSPNLLRNSYFDLMADDPSPSQPQPVFPHPRPYSLPHSSSSSSSGASSFGSVAPEPKFYGKAPQVDRSSSASLPLPNQLPFDALPKLPGHLRPSSHVGDVAKSTLREEPSESDSTDAPTPNPLRDPPPFKSLRNHDLRLSLSSQSSSLPPPDPPLIFPPPSPPRNMGTMSASPKPQTPPPPPSPHVNRFINGEDLPPVLPPRSTPRSSNPPDPGRPSTSSSSTTVSSPPHPQPNGQTSQSAPATSTSTPAYAPFLSHLPPPADSWIEVETTPSEYKLNVRLPGFKRDGITLATKRRRILHVVADSWENGGGHFERRISFGYDADLAQVRAEFDGEMLRIIIPRRVVTNGMGGMM